MLDVFDEVRHVPTENRGLLHQVDGGRRKSLLREDQELLANGTIMGVVAMRMVGGQEVDRQQQPARHGKHCRDRRDHYGGSHRAGELS
jgi:hypothetical protein